MAGKKQNNNGGRVLDEIVKNISDKSYPPVHLWNPEFCGDINMRIAVNGSWHYMDSPITRHEMVRLFSTVLRKDGDEYFLVTPVEKLAITVDDVPFFVVGMECFGKGKDQALSFETLTDDKVIADSDHTIRVAHDPQTGEPSPYIHIRGGMDGRISRAVYYELINLAEPMKGDKNTLGVWSSGEFFPLGQVDEGGE
ncbi:MAG: DUF1285 domain-containing protein [Sphingomonadales bacterium]|nr:DUF1285 domain-containing protein [Sphingomonadales bacterium]